MDVYAMSLVKLGCGNNLIGYYMYHGGTNKLGLTTLQESTATGYPNDVPVLNYDFQAPLSQYGEVREQYRLLNLLHLFVRDFGDILAPMEHVGAEDFVPETDRERLRCAIRTDGAGGFVFVNHHQRHLALRDVRGAELRPLGVRFPSIDVVGDVAFIFPFRLKLGKALLEWATAQLICRQGGTYYFAAIPGIPPRCQLAGGDVLSWGEGRASALRIGDLTLLCLSWEEARFLRRPGNEVLLGNGEDLYVLDGAVRRAGEAECALTAVPCSAPFTPPFEEELRLAGERKVEWMRLSAASDKGFVTLPGAFDVAQLYADGALAADKFDDGTPWRVPAALLYGRECYLARTAVWDGAYRE